MREPTIPDFSEVGKQYATAADVNDLKLFCYGCAYSRGGGEPFPSAPSGERPCFFCVRNREREQWQADFEKRHGRRLLEWYDGSPIAFYPMDAYQTIDMKEQQERWFRKDKGDPNWNEPKGGIRFG